MKWWFSTGICLAMLGLLAFTVSRSCSEENGEGLPGRMASEQGRQSGQGNHGKGLCHPMPRWRLQCAAGINTRCNAVAYSFCGTSHASEDREGLSR